MYYTGYRYFEKKKTKRNTEQENKSIRGVETEI